MDGEGSPYEEGAMIKGSVRAALTVLLALSVVGLPSARASHCRVDIVIFSYARGLGTPNLSTLCLFDDGHTVPYDYRQINPGSDTISVRYIGNLQWTSTTGSLDGLGFEGHPITLTRGETLGVVFYDSPLIAIPAGPLAQGCVKATIKVFEDEETGDVEFSDQNFHTVAESCPDYPWP